MSVFTVYVPEPAGTPCASIRCQVPPPVTSSGLLGGGRKVPEPVSVMLEPSSAVATALPPAPNVIGVAARSLTKSQRTCGAEPAGAEEPVGAQAAGPSTADTAAAVPAVFRSVLRSMRPR